MEKSQSCSKPPTRSEPFLGFGQGLGGSWDNLQRADLHVPLGQNCEFRTPLLPQESTPKNGNIDVLSSDILLRPVEVIRSPSIKSHQTSR